MENWVGFEDEEEEDTLSLSDFPAAGDGGDNLRDVGEPVGRPETKEFEFFGGGSLLPKGEDDRMCVADEVFFQGQILPLDRSFSSRASIGLDRSVGISGSQSTDSSRRDLSHRPVPFSGNLYARPSPRPQLLTGKQGFVDVVMGRRGRRRRRRGASAPVMGVLRFGLVQGPEYDLGDLRRRKIGSFHGGETVEPKKTPEKNGFGFLRNGFGCGCSAGDVLESISCCATARGLVENDGRKEEAALLSRRRPHRTCQWLEKLSAWKGHHCWLTTAAAAEHRRC